jgi:hypothetical protein
MWLAAIDCRFQLGSHDNCRQSEAAEFFVCGRDENLCSRKSPKSDETFNVEQ